MSRQPYEVVPAVGWDDDLFSTPIARVESTVTPTPPPEKFEALQPIQPPFASFATVAPVSRCPSYTRDVFHPVTFPGIVDWCCAQIVVTEPKISAVAGCGFSGILVAAAVGYKLGLPIIAVRKEREASHDAGFVNAVLPGGGSVRYAVIDDLVASGSTLSRIVEHVAHDFPLAKPGLVLLYHDVGGSDRDVYRAHDDLEGLPVRRKGFNL